VIRSCCRRFSFLDWSRERFDKAPRSRAVTLLRDLTVRERTSPVVPLQYSQFRYRPQAVRRRRCLLKGCEQWFQPSRPQARYCSEACRQAARRWRRWRASQQYRHSTHGGERRREQSRRYRQRRRQACQLQPEPACEGQRPARIFSGRCCDRPGCYERFAAPPRSPGQHFCSCSCRQALRRVRVREARWRQRRLRPAIARPFWRP
jgi:hypothetical protein